MKTLSVIPKPMVVEFLDGAFALKSDTLIEFEKAAESVASYLRNLLSPALVANLEMGGVFDGMYRIDGSGRGEGLTTESAEVAEEAQRGWEIMGRPTAGPRRDGRWWRRRLACFLPPARGEGKDAGGDACGTEEGESCKI